MILGDFVSGHHPGMFIELQKALDPLDETRVPVLSVLGNHDYAVARLPLLHEKMAMRRARVLRNEVVRVGEVTVWGIDDGLYGKDRHGELSARDDSGSVLALFHEPDFVDRVDDRVGLVLSGHTHGGQICLPFGIPLHLPRGGRKYRDGFYPEAPRPLFVTRGVGTIGPDLRTFCPPEVCVLTLVGT